MNFNRFVPASRRTLALALSTAAVAALVAALLWVVPRGGSSGAPAGDVRGRFRTSAPKTPSPSGKAVAPSRATVRSRPPARLFAGSASAAGILVRVCEGDNCTTLPQGNPATLEASNGSPLAFSLAARPAQAWLDVRGSSSDAPARVNLTPGTLMAYAPRMAPGRYLLTLGARFDGSEARWVFALKVTR